MLELYFAPGSSAMAVHIALEEIGAPFTPHPIRLAGAEMNATPFKTLNPNLRVPVLMVDGKPLTEVAACLFYLAKAYPNAKLLPDAGLFGDCEAISWMSFVASGLHPSFGGAAVRGRFPAYVTAEAGRVDPEALKPALRAYGVAEQRLGGRDWALGSYSVVDMHLFRLWWRFSNSARPDPALFPGLEAHCARMQARPAVQRVMERDRAVIAKWAAEDAA